MTRLILLQLSLELLSTHGIVRQWIVKAPNDPTYTLSFKAAAGRRSHFLSSKTTLEHSSTSMDWMRCPFHSCWHFDIWPTLDYIMDIQNQLNNDDPAHSRELNSYSHNCGLIYSHCYIHVTTGRHFNEPLDRLDHYEREGQNRDLRESCSALVVDKPLRLTVLRPHYNTTETACTWVSPSQLSHISVQDERLLVQHKVVLLWQHKNPISTISGAKTHYQPSPDCAQLFAHSQARVKCYLPSQTPYLANKIDSSAFLWNGSISTSGRKSKLQCCSWGIPKLSRLSRSNESDPRKESTHITLSSSFWHCSSFNLDQENWKF